MPLCTKNIGTNDFLDPYNIAQLADDTITLAEFFDSLQLKLKALFNYSNEKCQVPNIKKTLYANFTQNPITEAMEMDDDNHISSIDVIKGHNYLGMLFLPTDELIKILRFNIKNRKKHVAKYYAWLEVNENTPIETKLLVLDSCVLGAILYSCETWGIIDEIADELVVIDRQLVKRALGVKASTCNDTVFYEIKRPSIIAKIKDRQYAFFRKIMNLTKEDAVIKNIISLCEDSSIIQYYYHLNDNNCTLDIERLNRKIGNMDSSLIVYYRNLVGLENSCIYSHYINDYYRIIITRWRLSSHKLMVEVGRHRRPIVPREERVCSMCGVLEDEQHVIFTCPLYDNVRNEYEEVVTNRTIAKFLNPDSNMVVSTARLLYGIEKLRKDLKL